MREKFIQNFMGEFQNTIEYNFLSTNETNGIFIWMLKFEFHIVFTRHKIFFYFQTFKNEKKILSP